MAEMNLKSDFITDEELKNLKEHIMKWYDGGNTIADKKAFYQDALEDLLGVWIYGHWGEYTKTSMLIGSWMREHDKAAVESQELREDINNLFDELGCDNVRCAESKDMYHVYEVYTWDDVSYKKLESFHSKEEAEARCEELKKQNTFKAVTYKVMTDLQYYNLMH